MSKDEYLITDPPLKALTVFAMPMILGSFFQQVYNMADSIIVGQFVGSSALAAVGACAALTNVFICVALGAGVGAGVLVSRYFGAREYGKMKTIVSTSLISFLLLSIILGVFGFCFSHAMMSGLQTPADILDEAVLYLRVYFVGFPFLFMYNILSTMFTSIGESKIPLGLLIFSSILNIVMDLWMVAGLGLGVFGAALASAIGTTVGALMIVFYLMRRRCALRFHPIKMSRKSMQLMRRNIGYMCRLGSSAFLCEVAIACMMFVGNQVFIHYLKEDGVAAFSIACYFFPIIFMVYNAIAQSAQPIISYNYGLNESQRVCRAYLLALKTAIGCGVCFALVTIFCSPEIVGMFIDRSYPAYDIAVKGLPLYATGFVFFAVNIVSIGYFQSVERAKYATVITLLRGFILLTACFFGLPLLLGDRGIWLATPLAEMLTTLFILVIYISGKKEHKEKSVSLDKMGCTPT